MSNKIEELMSTSLEKLKSVVNGNTIIGDSITTSDGTVVIPISKVSYGFACGGSDFESKNSKDMFGGGNGAGVSISPVAFLVVANQDVKLLQIENFGTSTLDRIISMTPDVIDKIKNLVKKDK